MCFRIKLVQQFLTMISQKLSPDNLFGWSRTSETCMMEMRGVCSEPSSFLNSSFAELELGLHGNMLPPGSARG